VFLQQQQHLLLRSEAGLRIANLLLPLQESDESADLAGTATGEARSCNSSAPIVAVASTATTESGRIAHSTKAASTLTTETRQPGTALKTTTSRWSCRAIFTDGDLRVKTLTVMVEGANVGEQSSLGNRQCFECDLPSASSQQWLHQIEVQH
jgi:hypothetical protein